MKKVLILLTNHATLGTTDEANGTFAPELTHALHQLLDAGLDYDLVSIQGGKAPLYGTDIEGDTINSEILANEVFQTRVNNTIPATQINIQDYAAIYYPGGFGLLSDLASNEFVAQLSASHYEAGGVIGAVCHGPAGLLPITLSNGQKLIADKSVTGFTREEEVDYGTIDNIPFLLEEALTRTAARYNKVQPWNEFVIEDNRVITGQNPASASAVGKAIAAHIA
ncbi:type 1 glutamine amidotransferase domain-containing protein [Shewanella colwelliana]|uniref:Thiazole biosynthesis protein ThiJ n=1 Tax=Shewanella colwelliana TaxID=23 RepID=A0ABQ4NYM7_SHECO|nr:type 1 glutamine amidotransferase domain-containing protein [Shewanella colwelliana]MDX1281778.1 type 1 glutamine amidotransferase domain-containing protein [Shewanella colwelliana]GIU39861.1 thiazole biosynthesis protein ThiJ [Shewanella colwelliana]